MTSKKKIVYIGPQEQKTIKRGMHEYIFPRGVAVELDEQRFFEFMKFDDIFTTPENAKNVIQANEERLEAEKAAAEKQRLAQAQLDAVNSYKVIVDGQAIDISKYTSAKLATIIVSESLPIDKDAPIMEEGETRVEALRNRVRDALHKKHGNPDLQTAETEE